ncbi:MAG: hypothetical protein IT427_09120 [Pirellulales bacterium]|nr:hypothetical protein [Pirellulales bacterium]
MKMRNWRRWRPSAREAGRVRSAAVEMLEPRLALKWAGVPPASIAPPVVYTDVVLDADSDATGTAAITSSEIDYYKFQASSTGPYVISATTPSSNLNPILGVFSATGSRITYNDNISRRNLDSRVAVNLQDGVTYFVGITNRSSSSHGSYTWKIDGLWPSLPDDSYEQNDSFAAASDLGTLDSETTIGNLALRDQADWFKFTTINTGEVAHSVSIEFEHRRGDLDLDLSNDLGEVVGRSSSRGNVESISLAGLPAGTYYLRVFGYQGAVNPSYRLSIDPPTEAPPLPTVDLFGSLLKLDSGVSWEQALPVQAVIQNAGSTDAGAFNVKWYLSKDAKFSSGSDILLERTPGGGDSYRVSGVSGGSNSIVISVNLQLPEQPTGWDGKLYYLVMVTDSDGEITEMSENNNGGQIGGGFDNRALAFGRKVRLPNEGFDIDLSMKGLTVNEEAFVKAAAYRWEEIITGDLPDLVVQFPRPGDSKILDDLLIGVKQDTIDGPSTILAVGGPSDPRGVDWNSLPFSGNVIFDRADISDLEQSGDLYYVALHEIGHVLGLITIFPSLIAQDDQGNNIFTGPQATAEYVMLFGLDPAETKGVPLSGAHWPEDLFGDELMTPNLNSPSLISTISIAALADMGYKVDLTKADPWTAPASAASSGSLPGGGVAGQYAVTAASPAAGADAGAPQGLLGSTLLASLASNSTSIAPSAALAISLPGSANAEPIKNFVPRAAGLLRDMERPIDDLQLERAMPSASEVDSLLADTTEDGDRSTSNHSHDADEALLLEWRLTTIWEA